MADFTTGKIATLFIHNNDEDLLYRVEVLDMSQVLPLAGRHFDVSYCLTGILMTIPGLMRLVIPLKCIISCALTPG